MTNYVKLVNLDNGTSRSIECDPSKYLNKVGLEYFDQKRWKHAYIRIPRYGVEECYRNRYAIYVIEAEPLTVGYVAEYRENFRGSDIKVVDKHSDLVLYEGDPRYCPHYIKEYNVLGSSCTEKTLCLEVDGY